jgi:glycosyltransferase involved in cell wall biosynthesis
LRVLIVNNRFPPYITGGYEMSAALAAAGLERLGHDVQVIASRFGVGRALDEGFVRRRLHRTVDSPRPLAIVAYDWIDRLTIRRLVDRFRPDLVSVWNLQGIFPGVLSTLQASGLPLVYHLHDLWLPALEEWTHQWSAFWARPAGARGRALPKAVIGAFVRKAGLVGSLPPETRQLDHAVFCSEFARRFHEEHGVRARNWKVIFSGVDVDRLERTSRPARGPALRVLYVGRFVPEKGAHVAVRALRTLAERGHRNVRLSLLGVVPPDRAYYEGLVEAASDPLLSGRVVFPAAGPNDQMDAVYAEHDALVFPSTREGLPRTVMEAMACGLAIVSTTAGGTAEMVRDGVNALTFPVGDHEALALALLRLITEPALLGALSNEARRDARERFDVKRTVGQVESFYSGVVSHARTERVLR